MTGDVTRGFFRILIKLNVMIICLFSNSQKISNSLEALHSLGKRESPSDLNEHKIRR